MDENAYISNLHWLWRETNGQLDGYTAKVREGRVLDEAAHFASFVQFSGIIPLLKHHAQDKPLKIDGALLQSKAHELAMEVAEQYRKGAQPEKRDTQLEEIHHKLDLIAGRIAQIPVSQPLHGVTDSKVLQMPKKEVA